MNRLSGAAKAVLKKLPEIECLIDEPMRNHTSFKIGGPVCAMFLPKNGAQLRDIYAALREDGIKPFIMGNGTNLLADDTALDMVVIKTTALTTLALTGNGEITAGSGVLLSKIASFACENELTGFEFAHGIPGTLGGAVSMNAGAYGGEMKDVVYNTEVLGGDGRFFSVTGAEHGFSYRKSRFTNTDDIILSSVIKLAAGDSAEIKARMDELAARRRSSQPLSKPSAGSTFKRPKDGYAAALIEQAGLKGYTIGGAQVSEKHAGFVINIAGASFSDVLAVMEHITETVFTKFGVRLEPEVKILRNDKN